MRKPRLLMDVDGPIADFVGGVLSAAERIVREPIEREHIRQWDLLKIIQERFPDHRHLKVQVVDAIRSAGFCESLPPAPGAIEGMKNILSMGVDVYFVTSPWDSSPTWVYERTRWITKHFGTYLEKNIIHTHSKHVIDGDVMVDDKPMNIHNWLEHCDGAGLLWDMHHNQEAEADGLQRVFSWDELAAILEPRVKRAR